MTTESSLLSFVELGIPPYALRGITQTLEPIDQAKNTRRTINGILRDVASPDFQKFRSVIQCTDQQSPGLSGVWPGRQLTMWSAIEMSFEGSTDETDSFERPPVENSIREESGFTFYRPILVVMITDYRTEFAEWQADLAWQLEVEEV